MGFWSRTLLAALLLGCAWTELPAQGNSPAPAFKNATAPGGLTAEELATRLEEKNRERSQALCAFEGSRLYHLEYRGLGGSKDASMSVQVDFHAPASKTFTVVSQEGSKLIIEHVFKKLLASEQEAVDEKNLRATALSRDNYEFTLEGFENNKDGGAYVLSVKPRTRNKFLYQGRIWVNAVDFAVMRIDAVPAKNPSFWIKKTEIEHNYVKVGDFWFPATNRTESEIRIGGRAILAIDYTNYKILSAAPLGSSGRAGVLGAGASERSCPATQRTTAATNPLPATPDDAVPAPAPATFKAK
jgi:hypothetical protein